MILNERQYSITKAQAKKLAAALESASSPKVRGVDPRFDEYERRALASQLGDLRAELAEYEALRDGQRAIWEAPSLEELPKALIQARIARGMTQRDLAATLHVAEQQVQRYEATEYASASLTRLKEVAAALKVEVPAAVVATEGLLSPRQFFGRLSALGLDRELVLRRILPPELAKAVQTRKRAGTATGAILRAATLVGRVFSLTLQEFFALTSEPMQFAVASGARFKRSQRRHERTKDAYTAYARYIALTALRATPRPASETQIARTPAELRRILTERYGGVTLEAALQYGWDLGIPVVPLADSGAFHGACWRVDGRNVIVLKQKTRSLGRWLFDLLHELRHAAQDRDRADFAVIEGETGEAAADREQDAMRFAGDVILNGRAEVLAEMCVKAAHGKLERLKSVVPAVAQSEAVAVDALANYLAYRLAQQNENWWGAANNLQSYDVDPWWTTRDVLLTRLDFSELTSIDQQLLVGALSDSEVETAANASKAGT